MLFALPTVGYLMFMIVSWLSTQRAAADDVIYAASVCKTLDILM